MDYVLIKRQIEALTEECPHETANLANTAALLRQALPCINWVGFYKLHKEVLILGPFQGKPACVEIRIRNGVCGAAVREDRLQRVEDVHAFPGHIACDCASNAELVIPLHCNGKIWGVLDIDSPEKGRFTEADAEGLKEISTAVEAFLSREKGEAF